MGDPNAWDTAQEILRVAAPDRTPIVESVDFRHEVLEQRDGSGNVIDTIVVLRGATVEIGLV